MKYETGGRSTTKLKRNRLYDVHPVLASLSSGADRCLLRMTSFCCPAGSPGGGTRLCGALGDSRAFPKSVGDASGHGSAGRGRRGAESGVRARQTSPMHSWRH